MKKSTLFIYTILCTFSIIIGYGQENKGYKSPFKQLKEELPTPNSQRTASGAPGYKYTQQQVDYDMNIVLNDDKKQLFGEATITYHNNSTDSLEYLWIQLDQNVREPNSLSKKTRNERLKKMYSPQEFTKLFIENPYQGGFHIDYLKDTEGNDIQYTINWTMMRVHLPKPLAPNETFTFKTKWWYNINDYTVDGGRSGYEPFPNNTNIYIIAQFFPRLAVYNNVEGWQNMQFWGRSEFALEFGNYNVNITVPKNHILHATGTLLNPEKVLTAKQFNRYQKAKNWFDKPKFIVTPEEALRNERTKSDKTQTWKFYAENVRDFAFSSSQKFMWDAQAVKMNTKTVMAYSLYPKEGNPLWQEVSTKAVVNALKTYSHFTFDYPYPHATSVNAKWQGMEYPMICWNHTRIGADGKYSVRTKKSLILVITHEIGHNFFPMIVNSDERQWSWMDEGINSFVQIYALNDYDKELFPLSRYPKNVVRYMSGDQSKIAPIMTQGDDVFNFGSNAYHKPAAGLFILRETIMGRPLFDYAFKTYAKRWKFKHPTPADFFRTMEDASAMDLDWFWRGWFYTTQTNDLAIKEVKKYSVSLSDDGKKLVVSDKNIETKHLPTLQNYLEESFAKDRLDKLKIPKYIYKVTTEKLGDLLMPLIIELTFEDGSKLQKKFPAETWRRNAKTITKLFPTTKIVKSVAIDPNEQTADIDMSNNFYPKKNTSQFDKFKRKKKK